MAGNVSPKALNDSRTRLEATKTILEAQDSDQLGELTREDLLGDLFHAGVLGYYGQYTALSYVAGLRQGGHHYLAGGVGSYGYEPEVEYYFGMPRKIFGGGAAMNIPIVNVNGYDGDGSTEAKESRLNYILQLGTLSSALEHAVPEQMFVTPENPGEAISAVKALSKASAAGQRIYHITQANQSNVLPNIHLNSLVMDEIRSALATGKEIITHTDAVSVPGWSGAGYIIYDPVTGDGAYKIGGGKNGMFILLLFSMLFPAIIAPLLWAYMTAGAIEKSWPELYVSLSVFTQCLITDMVESATLLLGLMVSRGAVISRLAGFFGPAAAVMFWMAVFFVFVMYIAAIMNCVNLSDRIGRKRPNEAFV